MKKKIYPAFSALLLTGIFFTSCLGNETVQSINETEIFKLSYGKFEEELSSGDLNNIGDVRFGITMQDGFFYIINGEAKKIMELNSYGDLLTLFYNEDSETAGIINKSNREKESVHHEVSYPFDYPGKIAVDYNKNIYTVCTIPKDRQELSDDGNTLYSQTILRFSRDGSTVEYLGQQGPGGTPFPYIKNIYTTIKNELVVSALSAEGTVIYWFSSDGFLKYMIPVTSKNVPLPNTASASSEQFWTISNVIPDPFSYTLYVQVDYYSTYLDEDSKVQSGVNFIQTLLYPLNVESGLYDKAVTIPPYEESVVSDYSRMTYRIPYDFLGVTRNGWKFFIVKTDSGFNIEMIQTENQRILRRQFNVNHNNVLYDCMSLSLDGIITAMYLEPEAARVVWYRTDNLIEAIIK